MQTGALVVGGRSGALYVIDLRAPMVKPHAPVDPGALQVFPASLGAIRAGLVYWAAGTGERLYVAGHVDLVRAYRYADHRVETIPFTTSLRPTGERVQLALSADGARPESGILWTLESAPDRTAVLRAFDAEDLQRELYSSDGLDAAGTYAPDTYPTVARGKVLVPVDGALRVYGLRP